MLAAFAIAVGVAGTVIVLSAYGLLSAGRLRADTPRYQWLNIMGTLAIVASLLVQWNLPSFILNTAWAVIGIAGLIRIYRKRAQHGME